MAAPAVVNGGFEEPYVASGHSGSTPAPGWTAVWGSGTVRVQRLASGTQALYQYTNVDNFAEQVVEFDEAGTYKILFEYGWITGRGHVAGVRVDGELVWSTPVDNDGNGLLIPAETPPLALAPGAHTIGLHVEAYSAGRAIWDNVSIVEAAPVAAPGRLACFGPGRAGLVHTS